MAFKLFEYNNFLQNRIDRSHHLLGPAFSGTMVVANLSLPGGQDKMISSIFPHFPVASLIFPQVFFLILVFRVGGLPTREGPGYATVWET